MKTNTPVRRRLQMFIGDNGEMIGKNSWQVRSNMTCTARLFDEIREDLTDKRIEMMKNTTFGEIFMACLDVKVTEEYHSKSRVRIISILECYNKNDRTFQFGDTIMQLKPSDVSKIFGLTMIGEKINLSLEKSYCLEGEFTQRWFKGEKVISKLVVEKMVKKCVKGTNLEDDSHFVLLMCVYLCTTLLFNRQGPCLPWCILKYIANFSNLNSYNWSEAVLEFLTMSLDKQCLTGLAGCALLLPFWICEELKLIQPIKGRENCYPKFLRWDLLELGKEMRKTNLKRKEISTEGNSQAHCEEESVSPKKRKTMSLNDIFCGEQKKRVKAQLVATNKSVMISVIDGESKTKAVHLKKSSICVEKTLKCVMDTMPSETENMETPYEEIGNQKKKITEEKPTREFQQQCGQKSIVRTKWRSMRTCERKSHRVSDKEKKVERERIVMIPKVVEQTEIIDIEALIVKPQKSKKTDKKILISTHKVSKFLDNQVIMKLQIYCDNAETGNFIMQSNKAIGKLDFVISRQDLIDIFTETSIGTNVLDSYAELTLTSQISMKRAIQTLIITSMCMHFIQKEMKSCIQSFIHEQILEHFGSKDLVFFPLSHSNLFHFTLLVLNKKEQVWYHYNTLLPRKMIHKDPTFEDARKVHAAVQEYLQEMKENANKILSDGMIRRVKRKGGMNATTICKEEKLTEKEKTTLLWLKDASIDFPIKPCIHCPQQKPGSLDCGPAVLFLMEQLRMKKKIPKTFSEDCMVRMRANILSKFLRNDGSWNKECVQIID